MTINLTKIKLKNLDERVYKAVKELQESVGHYGLSWRDVNHSGLLSKTRERLSESLKDYYIVYSKIGSSFSPFMGSISSMSQRDKNEVPRYSYQHNRIIIQPPFDKNIYSVNTYLSLEAMKSAHGKLSFKFNPTKISGKIFPYENISDYFARFDFVNELTSNNKNSVMLKPIRDTTFYNFIEEASEFVKSHYTLIFQENKKIKGPGFILENPENYLLQALDIISESTVELKNAINSEKLPPFYNRGNIEEDSQRWMELCRHQEKRKLFCDLQKNLKNGKEESQIIKL